MNVEHVMLSKALATSDAESRLYEFNARNQITLWGPDGGSIFLDIVYFEIAPYTPVKFYHLGT